MKILKKNYSSLALPGWCFNCDKYLVAEIKSPINFLCSKCYQEISWLDPGYCSKCGLYHKGNQCEESWSPRIDQFWEILNYIPPVSKWISQLKYGKSVFAGRILKRLLNIWFDKHHEMVTFCDYLLPIPIHSSRLFLREFNQCSYLIQEQKLFEIRTDILAKTKRSPHQAQLSRKERLKNLTNTLSCIGNCRGDNILLFDDVCSTGQTVSIAAQKLIEQGAASVSVLVLARNLKR